MHNKLAIILIFVMAAVIFGGTGFLVQMAVCKSAKNKWIKFIPAGVVFCLFLSMLLTDLFFFYYVAVGLILAGMAVALIFDFEKKEKHKKG